MPSGDRKRRNKEYDLTSSSNCTGNSVAYENQVIQPSRSDLRVDGFTQEDVYNDKQYMEQVKKQVEKLQDETISQSIKKDLQEGVLLSTETSLKVKDMDNIELSLSTTTDSDIPMPAVLNSYRGRISILSQMLRRYTSGRFRNVKTLKESSIITWQFVLGYQDEKSRRQDTAATMATTSWQSKGCREAQSARRNFHLHSGPLPKWFKLQKKAS